MAAAQIGPGALRKSGVPICANSRAQAPQGPLYVMLRPSCKRLQNSPAQTASPKPRQPPET